MKSEQEIRAILELLESLDYKTDEISGMITALAWVLEKPTETPIKIPVVESRDNSKRKGEVVR